ncbi:MAG: tRNA nucleotidyltransferase/poly(A) polymerase, partial [Planctomycetota bacterium]
MDALAFVRQHAPWLAAPELGVCIVGSQALAIACRDAGIDGPNPSDLDLSWALDHEAGTALLEQHGVFVPTTTGSIERGTQAAKIGGERIEITTFRTGDNSAPMKARIKSDLSERDMTIGAIAVQLDNGRIHDPFEGLKHYRERRIAPVGDAALRVTEHGIRWLRYFRKAHEFGFLVDNSIRGLKRNLDPSLLLSLPKEAVALELRAILTKTKSPGRCFLDLYEVGLLNTLSPSIARQFDGRPAGPQRWHPEVSQALHLILALDWAVANTTHFEERDRTAVLFAVLCHDLGKSDSKPDEFPHHRGHEAAGIPHIEQLATSWPGLMDQRTSTLAKHVSALHLEVRRFDELRSGTKARIYDEYFRAKDYPIEPFATAVAADSAGRLSFEHEGPTVRDRVIADLQKLRAACSTVDAGALRAQHAEDLDAFR